MRYRSEWIEANVVAAENITSTVRQIDITPVKGTESYTAGSHIDVQVIINGQPEIRSYSLVGVYEKDKAYRIAVKKLRASRGGSAYMWNLQEGAVVKISRPVNHFELSYHAKRYILVAGGIGITPIVGMAKVLYDKKATIEMIYAASTENDLPYADELKQLLGDKLIIHTTEQKQCRYDFTSMIGEVQSGTQLYLCGPMGIMNEVRRQWELYKLPAADLRFETFGASGQFAPQAFYVRVPRMGIELKVQENQSLLDALHNAGADIMYDCRKGECGLCTVDILSCNGVVDHRDFFFSEHQKAENKKMCACVSRVVNGDIVVDTAYRGTSKTDEIKQFV